MLNVTIYRVEIELLSHLLGTCPRSKEVYSDYIASKAAKALAVGGLPGLKGNRFGMKAPVLLANGEAASEESVAIATAEECDTVPETVTEESLAELEEKGWTGFHTDEEGPFLYDYALKAFLCSVANNLADAKTQSKKDGASESKAGERYQLMDKFKKFAYIRGSGASHSQRRRIRLPWPKDKPLPYMERPLRAMTLQGPRVTVVRSDYIPEGTRINFEIHLLRGGDKKPTISQEVLEDVLAWGEYMGLGQWRSGGWGAFSLVSLEKA